MKTWGELRGIRPVKIIRNMILSGIDNPLSEFISQYDVSEEKAVLAESIARREIDILSNIKDNEIGLYVGIPFCKTRCLYCSFVTCATGRNDNHLQKPYVDALVREIEYSKRIVAQLGCKVRVAYIGGGTPTALSAELLDRVMKEINIIYPDLLEYTVEAGRADTINKEKLDVIKNNGCTRLCINPQTMNDWVLEAIGRRHTAAQVEEAFALARSAGFDNINMDIIAGLPKDDVKSFSYTVKKICDMDPEGITVHTMSVKRGSRLYEELGKHQFVTNEQGEEMIAYSAEYLNMHGYLPYYLYRQKNILADLENVGYSKFGFEGIYNIMIMEETATIISLGAGGVTKTVNKQENRIERVFNYKEAYNYIEGIDEILKRKDEILKIY